MIDTSPPFTIDAMFTTVWRFTVRPDATAEFERHYGPDGTWVQLFKSTPGYIDTALYRDITRDGEYLTIDRWVDERTFRAFRESHGADYERLDRELASLTTEESHLGDLSGR